MNAALDDRAMNGHHRLAGQVTAVGAQLELFGGCDAVPVVRTAPPEPPVVEAGEDPLQTDLFDGPYRERHEAELACRRLDGPALRRAHASAARSYPRLEAASAWPGWAEALDWLGAADPVERASRALALDAGGGAQRLAGMPAELLALVRREALARAARDVIEAGGPAAEVLGRPAGWLLLAAGLPDEAVRALEAAADAAPLDARVRAALGVAHDRAGRPDDALEAWCQACLLDPGCLDERHLSPAAADLLDLAADLEDLPGDPREWLPVLADLTGAAALPRFANEAPPESSPARRFAALLRAYRDAQSQQSPAERRRELKRAMIALAPAAKELVRRI
ncbi:MAG: hypothetical protein HYY06_11505 [Deltaproteobacteria bacterium]|nr:hypothetical protein [Deltaproteobacteria bacterium]